MDTGRAVQSRKFIAGAGYMAIFGEIASILLFFIDGTRRGKSN